MATDPDDQGVFVHSMAARDRLGGLSDQTIAASALMRALFDRVLIESVGIGQSEADISFAVDSVILCVQPGSGDSLQFMKAGVMELPDIVVVTKADMGDTARRAKSEVEGALTLFERDDDWRVPGDSGLGLDRRRRRGGPPRSGGASRLGGTRRRFGTPPRRTAKSLDRGMDSARVRDRRACASGRDFGEGRGAFRAGIDDCAGAFAAVEPGLSGGR